MSTASDFGQPCTEKWLHLVSKGCRICSCFSLDQNLSYILISVVSAAPDLALVGGAGAAPRIVATTQGHILGRGIAHAQSPSRGLAPVQSQGPSQETMTVIIRVGPAAIASPVPESVAAARPKMQRIMARNVLQLTMNKTGRIPALGTRVRRRTGLLPPRPQRRTSLLPPAPQRGTKRCGQPVLLLPRMILMNSGSIVICMC